MHCINKTNDIMDFLQHVAFKGKGFLLYASNCDEENNKLQVQNLQ